MAGKRNIMPEGPPIMADLQQELERLRQGQRQLEQALASHRQLLDHTGEGILVIQDGRPVFHNQPLLDATGLSAKEFADLDFLALVHPDERERVRLLLETGTPPGPGGGISEFRFQGRQGRLRRVRVRTRPITWLDHPATMVLLSDVTARGQAEEDFRASEERYRSLVENVPYGLCIAELPSTRFLFFNNTAAEMFGYTREEAAVLSIWSVLEPSQVERAKKGIKARLEGQGPETRQIYDGIKKDGSRVRFEVRSSPVLYMGKPAFQAILQDVTEIERLERQVQYAQKMEAVGTLAGGVAHEFNNRLMVIGGYSQLLAQAKDTSPSLANYALKINESVKLASGLTKALLSFSRKEPGVRSPVEMWSLTERLAGILRQTLPRNIEVKVTVEPGLPKIMANPNQMEQVILNLALNSRDAMPEGGSLELGLRLAELGVGFCRDHPWAQPGRYLELSARDTGEGMTPEVLERIFEPFFTTKQPGQGTGLGLAVVYTMVKSHGGYVVSESEAGRGTLMRVLLPVEESPEAAPVSAPREEAPPRPGQGQRILVVDDDKNLREIGRRALEDGGYEIEEADNGQSALEAFRAAREQGRPFALVILDLAMPVMDGRQCLLELRRAEPGCKVLVATGYGKSRLSDEEIASQTMGVLAKPYDLDELASEVARALTTPAP